MLAQPVFYVGGSPFIPALHLQTIRPVTISSNKTIAEFARVLRDHRNGETRPIDPRLLDQLHDVREKLGLSQAFRVISGYRSPTSNAMLHERSSGVASNSLHLQGRAIDISAPGIALERLRAAALDAHAGGVGYYPRSGFVHLDTGRVRVW